MHSHAVCFNVWALLAHVCQSKYYIFVYDSIFCTFKFSELRTEAAEGLVKLMFSGRLIGARLLSRLVLLWYNPVTEDDTRLRHCLGVFFPLFAYANRYTSFCYSMLEVYVAFLFSGSFSRVCSYSLHMLYMGHGD